MFVEEKLRELVEEFKRHAEETDALIRVQKALTFTNRYEVSRLVAQREAYRHAAELAKEKIKELAPFVECGDDRS